MRIAENLHLEQPWRIHELAPDFRLEDVWALPATGAENEFADLVGGFAEADPGQYLLDREYAAKIANQTMHGILHLTWVPEGDHFRGVMAVYVKPNGLFGDAYMAAIRPFQHRVVYPPVMRQIDGLWRARKVPAHAA